MTVDASCKVYIGASTKPEYLQLPFANRHGVVTGATGTGKTVTLQILAEGFSNAGVPVFCSDIKGDVAGLAVAGEPKDFLAKRAETIGFADAYRFESFRSEEHTSELQSLMRISYAVFCLQKKKS